MDKLTPQDLVGKTIKSINSRAVNCWHIEFTDETRVDLEAETAVQTCAGSIPGIFLTTVATPATKNVTVSQAREPAQGYLPPGAGDDPEK